MNNKVIFKITDKRHFNIQANPIEITYIKGKPYVIGERHYNKYGTFNGYLIPYHTGKSFIWNSNESLKIRGIALTTRKQMERNH